VSQKSLGWWLIFSGIILLILNIVAYNLLVIVWNKLNEFYWIIILLSSIGIVSIILGGIKMRYNMTSWIVLSGVIILFVSFVVTSLIMSLGGELLSYVSIIPILIVIGLGCVVVGALIDKK